MSERIVKTARQHPPPAECRRMVFIGVDLDECEYVVTLIKGKSASERNDIVCVCLCLSTFSISFR